MDFLNDILAFCKINDLTFNIDVKQDHMIFNFISGAKKKSYHKIVYNADLVLNEKETIGDMLNEITAVMKREKHRIRNSFSPVYAAGTPL